MSEPLLSVVMPVWNGAEFIEEAVRSLLDQHDAGPLEVVVADDGSTDASADVAEAAGARVVRRPHAGVAAARNVGLAAARGELLTFLDADDVSVPGSLRARRDLLAVDPGLDFVVGQLDVFGPGRDRLPPWVAERVVGGSPAGGLWSFFAPRALFDRIGPFDESFELAEDADWLGRVRATGARGGTVESVCTLVRLHSASLTARRRDEVRPTLLRAMRAQVARQRAER
jgi:glycosyltransferase involved in cell wall biosynthesis